MIERTMLEGCKRAATWMIAAAACGLATGCAVTTVQYADRQIESYLKALTLHTPYPLARTLTWKYHYTVGTGKDEQAWFIADGKLLRSASELAGVQMYAAQPATSGMNMSDVYTQRAREATNRGDHGSAQFYHGLSSTALQTQIASERVATGIAFGGAIQGLGAALLDATIISHGLGAAQYVEAADRGVIGRAAPEGTVLELFFRGIRLDGAEAKPGNLSMKWETAVTLKDADGKIWRSDAFFTNYFFHSFGPEQKATPAGFNDPRYLLMVPNSLIPAHNRAFGPEEIEMAKILNTGGAAEFGVTAMQAIGDLYEQMARGGGKR